MNISELRQQMQDWLKVQRLKIAMLWAILSSFFVASGAIHAQSVSVSISPDDLNVFFDWFNTMFSVILPIALIGAGIVAGAAFAFVVGNMLKKAFSNLAGGAK